MRGEHLGEGYDGVVCPGDVGGYLDGAAVVVGIGGTDAHTDNGIDATHLIHQGLQTSHTCLDKFLGCAVGLGLDGILCHYISLCIDDAKDGVGASEVHTDCVVFRFVHVVLC